MGGGSGGWAEGLGDMVFGVWVWVLCVCVCVFFFFWGGVFERPVETV